MLTALTRPLSPSIGQCELTFLPRQRIDLALAEAQHAAYERHLIGQGARVVRLPAEADLPDAVFVEDTAVVLDEVAVITRMGAPSRRGESPSVERMLGRYRPLLRMQPPGTLDGGDVVRIGKTLYIGSSGRTNEEGLAQVRGFLEPFGYRIQPVAVRGCLHLKSACSYLGRDTLLANPDWVDPSVFGTPRVIEVAPSEPHGAGTLRIGDVLAVPDAFPLTRARLQAHGFQTVSLELGELQKAEAGPTCLSILFEAPG